MAYGPHEMARLLQGPKDKAPAKGAAKRAKKGAAEQAEAPAPPVGGSEPQEQAAMEVDADSGDMDTAVVNALDASEGGAEPPAAVTAVAQQPAARGERAWGLLHDLQRVRVRRAVARARHPCPAEAVVVTGTKCNNVGSHCCVRAGTAGGRARRVMRTYINDMGEEVTEEVAVEEEYAAGAAPAPAAPASAAAPAAGAKGGSKAAAAPAAKPAPAKGKVGRGPAGGGGSGAHLGSYNGNAATVRLHSC